jgi:hypothetical protein
MSSRGFYKLKYGHRNVKLEVEAPDKLTDRSAKAKFLEEIVVFFCLGYASNFLGHGFRRAQTSTAERGRCFERYRMLSE